MRKQQLTFCLLCFLLLGSLLIGLEIKVVAQNQPDTANTQTPSLLNDTFLAMSPAALEARLSIPTKWSRARLSLYACLLNTYWDAGDLIMMEYTYIRLEAEKKRGLRTILKEFPDWEKRTYQLAEIADRASGNARLEAAKQAFERGDMHRVPALLTSVLADKKLNEAESIEGYLLIARALLALEQIPEALDALLEVIRLAPNYQVPLDDVEMIYLYRMLQVRPWGYIDLWGGGNYTLLTGLGPDVLIPYACPGGYQQQLQLTPGFQAGAGVSIRLSSKFSVAGGLSYQGLRWAVQSSGLLTDFSQATPCEMADTLAVFSYTEQSQFVQGHIRLQYSWTPLPDDYILAQEAPNPKRFYPYIYGGITHLWLGRSRLNSPSRTTNLTTGNGNQGFSIADVEGPSLSLSPLRRTTNVGWMVGGGIGRKVGRGFLSLDLRYTSFLQSLNQPTARYETPQTDILFFR